MTNAADVVTAAHVADGHEVGIDHAGQQESRMRLADHAQAAQSIQSILHGGGGDHVDNPLSEHAHEAGARLHAE